MGEDFRVSKMDPIYDFYDGGNFTEEGNGQSDDNPAVHLTTLDLVRICLSTLATGVFMALSLWALIDITSRRRTIHSLSNNFFCVLSVVFATICLLETVEFFVVYDFLFYKSIAWAIHGQWLAFFIECSRILQYSVILAIGIHQIMSLLRCCDFGLVGALIYGCNFVAVTLLPPILALILGLYHGENALGRLVHPVLVPFTTALMVGGTLFFTATKRLFKMSAYDVLATKVVLIFHLVIVGQALEASTIDLICYAAGYNEPWYFVNTLEDINRPLYPMIYLIMFRHEAFSVKIFKSLNDGEGVHRIPTNSIDGMDIGHEMQDTGPGVALSFPTALFSVTSEDEQTIGINSNPFDDESTELIQP